MAGFLGAGREKKEQDIDATVGIVLAKKVGYKVNQKDVLAYVHANDVQKLQKAKEKLKDIIKISQDNVLRENTIWEVR